MELFGIDREGSSLGKMVGCMGYMNEKCHSGYEDCCLGGCNVFFLVCYDVVDGVVASENRFSTGRCFNITSFCTRMNE